MRHPLAFLPRRWTDHGGRGLSRVVPESKASKTLAPEATVRKATWLRFAPLLGLGCPWLALASIAASFIILKLSDDTPVTSWRWEPSVYIGILTAIANQSIRFAALEGVAIAWWTSGLKGTTLASLRRDCGMGTSLWSSLNAGRKTDMLAIACIFSTFVAVDGPLLQRASSFKVQPIGREAVTLNVTISQEVPTGCTGTYAFYANAPSLNPSEGAAPGQFLTYTSPIFDAVSNDFVHNQPMAAFIGGCPGHCEAQVHAPAVAAVACDTHILPFQPHRLRGNDSLSSATADSADPTQDQATLTIFAELLPGDTEMLNVTVAQASIKDCKGDVNVTSCLFASALGKYDIVVTGENVTFAGDGIPRIVALANNTGTAAVRNTARLEDGANSTLAGPFETLQQKWSVIFTTLLEDGDYVNNMQGERWSAMQYLLDIDEGPCSSYRHPFGDHGRSE